MNGKCIYEYPEEWTLMRLHDLTHYVGTDKTILCLFLARHKLYLNSCRIVWQRRAFIRFGLTKRTRGWHTIYTIVARDIPVDADKPNWIQDLESWNWIIVARLPMFMYHADFTSPSIMRKLGFNSMFLEIVGGHSKMLPLICNANVPTLKFLPIDVLVLHNHCISRLK